MPSPRLRHEAIFLLVFALDLVNMFIATVAIRHWQRNCTLMSVPWHGSAPPTCWA